MSDHLGLGVFAAELQERLLWFTRLRWWAVIGMLAGSWFGPLTGFPPVWSWLAWVAVASVCANVFFRFSMLGRAAVGRPHGHLQGLEQPGFEKLEFLTHGRRGHLHQEMKEFLEKFPGMKIEVKKPISVKFK